MTSREAIAQLLRAEIKTSGQWHYLIAEAAGITEKHLSQILHLKVSPSLDVIDRILAACGQHLVFVTEPLIERHDVTA